MTSQLSCHVEKFPAIMVSEFGLDENNICIKFELWWKLFSEKVPCLAFHNKVMLKYVFNITTQWSVYSSLGYDG